MIRAHSGSRTHTAHAIEPFEAGRRVGPLSATPYKKQAIKAAKQLGYSKEILDRIEAAESEGEINRIMKTARKEKFDV